MHRSSALALAVVMALLGGCGSSDDESERASSPTTPTPSATEPAGQDLVQEEANHAVEEEYNQPPKPRSGDIGDTIVLNGINIGVRLRVTVTGVQDSVTAARSPGPGKRWVGVKLRVKSTGIAIYESEMRNVVLRYGSKGRSPAAFGVKGRCSNGFEAHMRLDVGDSANGCLLFRVPSSQAPKMMQLALETRPVQEGGKWRLQQAAD
jgi:hypothetical protein